MRSVIVYPTARELEIRTLLGRRGEYAGRQWTIDDVLYVRLHRDGTELLSDSTQVQYVAAALRQAPGIAAEIEVSGRIEGRDEVKDLTLQLLSEGGVALDDHSSTCWTATDVRADRICASRRFFDSGRLYEPITPEHARELAEDRVPPGLIISRVKDVQVGWVFYINHPDPRVQLGGNGPILVDRTDASVHQLWTVESVETQLTRYRQEGRALPHHMEERFGPSLDP